MNFKTDRNRVNGLGSAKEGTHHWLMQRVTAIAMIPLSLLFVWNFLGVFGANQAAVVAKFQQPFVAFGTMLFVLVAFQHLQQGLQVVIEDYVHGKVSRTVLVLLNILLTWGFALAGVFALAKIAFNA
ncbi:MAG: succinate dehydrogenase / fumarate reductase membrane anchor subunit [Planctomycetota bacterium]|jgi:succinate dehydrogenase / fumarate reductase membrane anchor subunit